MDQLFELAADLVGALFGQEMDRDADKVARSARRRLPKPVAVILLVLIILAALGGCGFLAWMIILYIDSPLSYLFEGLAFVWLILCHVFISGTVKAVIRMKKNSQTKSPADSTRTVTKKRKKRKK